VYFKNNTILAPILKYNTIAVGYLIKTVGTESMLDVFQE
jgi:hypothetical protein